MEPLHKTFHCGFLGASPDHTREPGWLLDRTSGIRSSVFAVKVEKCGFASWQLLLPLPSKDFDQPHEQRAPLDSWRFLCELTSLILTPLLLSLNMRGQRISCCRDSFFVVLFLFCLCEHERALFVCTFGILMYFFILCFKSKTK